MNAPIIGIDLGTTNSCAAIVDESGRPTILKNSEGAATTPSVVYFDQEGRPVVGRHALESLPGFPDRTVRWIKRQMGNPSWRFTLPSGQEYSAVELSSLILKKLRADSEHQLDTTIEEAVITVPAYFDEIRRASTMEAASLAGLKVKRLINEPSAAALSYARSRKGSSATGRVLIYDFGGGTFDVSIVDLSDSGDVTVLASEGVHWLGGYDLDVELAKHYQRSANQDAIHIYEGTPEWRQLVSDAETNKHTLSKLDRVIGRAQAGDRLFNLPVSRSQHEKLIGPLITQTRMEIEHILDLAGLAPREIDEVVLVGGSTRIPLVKRMVTDVFGRDPITPGSVDELVCMGAAIEASLSEPAVKEVATHSYGTIARSTEDPAKEFEDVNVHLISKRTQIPASGSRTFFTRKDNQRRINCIVTQGEGDDPATVVKLSTKPMRLSKGLPAGSPIDVEFSYDVNMRMRCTFTERMSGSATEIELDPLRSSTTPNEPATDEPFPASVDLNRSPDLLARLAELQEDTSRPSFLGKAVRRLFGRDSEAALALDTCILEILLSVGIADGQLTESTEEILVSWIRDRKQTLKLGLQGSYIRAVRSKVEEVLPGLEDACIHGRLPELVAARADRHDELSHDTPSAVPDTIQLCLRIALANHSISKREEELLLTIASALGVPTEHLESQCRSSDFTRALRLPKGYGDYSRTDKVAVLRQRYGHLREMLGSQRLGIRCAAAASINSIVTQRYRLERQRTVFVSHASGDQRLVQQRILSPLRRLGLKPWFAPDPETLPAGVDFEQKIKEGIDQAEWFVVILSQQAAGSKWVKAEVGLALDEPRLEGRVVPILVKDCRPEDVHLLLKNINYLDARAGDVGSKVAQVFK